MTNYHTNEESAPNFINDETSPNIIMRLLPAYPGERNDPICHTEIAIPHTSVKIRFLKGNGSDIQEITSADLARWNIAKADLPGCAAALHSNDFVIQPIEKAAGLPSGLEPTNLNVITNASGVFGASAVLYPAARANLQAIYPCGYWLIPSSVHEMIAVEANTVPADYVLKIIAEINQTYLLPGEFLSNELYEPDPQFGLKLVK